MFDPFLDFEVAGYLRNVRKDKDPIVIKHFEHNLFRLNLPKAIEFLVSRSLIGYDDFLETHQILFGEYYPWAGKDRTETMPDAAVAKGAVLFCHPRDSRRSVEHALYLASNAEVMYERPGEIMGLFAYAHPFLDGNGRTMLLVHTELSLRAGFSIDWASTNKRAYLDALSREIDSPGRGCLDSYLKPFKFQNSDRSELMQRFLSIKGLDGIEDQDHIVGYLSEASTLEMYRQYEASRNYDYKSPKGVSPEIRVTAGSN